MKSPAKMNLAEYNQQKKGKKGQPRIKNARKVDTPFGRFDSGAEYERFCELLRQQIIGEISGLRTQVGYAVSINGIHICEWIADFVYVINATGEEVKEDLKGHQTDVFKLKRKMVEAYHGFKILVTPAKPMDKRRDFQIVQKGAPQCKMTASEWRRREAEVLSQFTKKPR